jgi:hypothetical protein
MAWRVLAVIVRLADVHCCVLLCFVLCCAPRTKIKCRVETISGSWVEKIPAWIKWATQVGIPDLGIGGGAVQLAFRMLVC